MLVVLFLMPTKPSGVFTLEGLFLIAALYITSECFYIRGFSFKYRTNLSS